MNVDLRLAPLVDAVLDLLEHTHVLEVGKAALDRLLAFEEPLLRVDAGAKPLKGLTCLHHPLVGLLGGLGVCNA